MPWGTREEIETDRAADAVILTMNASSFEGSPQGIAAVLRPMSD